MTTARVELWGSSIGAVTWDRGRNLAFFEYDPAFLASGIELSPIHLPLREGVFSFPGLGREAFRGLPGMLADSLPDRFGNAIIDAWLASRGRSLDSFDPVERLCYVGSRGMGGLEFAPALGPQIEGSEEVDLASLVELASAVLTDRARFIAHLAPSRMTQAVHDILRVSTSAGGARAKAVIAWNPDTGEVRSGQVDAGQGFSYWLLKFDGVQGNRDRELDDPLGFGLVEFAYSMMARAAGIEMSECRILEENGRHHFMTKRFDRRADGDKVHMQSLAALGHMDLNLAGAHSYEQAAQVMRALDLPASDAEQAYRRMAFNVIARNQDDHVKNIAFLMDRSGRWSLSPAFDVTYAFNPEGRWTSRHQMSVNGKRDGFELADLVTFGDSLSLKRGRAKEIAGEVHETVLEWPRFAEEAHVPEPMVDTIRRAHRLDLVESGGS